MDVVGVNYDMEFNLCYFLSTIKGLEREHVVVQNALGIREVVFQLVFGSPCVISCLIRIKIHISTQHQGTIIENLQYFNYYPNSPPGMC